MTGGPSADLACGRFCGNDG